MANPAFKTVFRFGDGREESITDDDFVDSFLEYVLEFRSSSLAKGIYPGVARIVSGFSKLQLQLIYLTLAFM